MKKEFYTLSLLLIFSNFGYGQIKFSFVGSGTEEKVLRHLDKASQDKDNLSSGYKFSSSKYKDT